MRNKIFISHASCAFDEEFSKWLSLKLIALGYNVWCDVLELNKGVDFWKVIEREIRENSIKFLAVVSEESITKSGVLNEISLASKVRTALKDESFIIPVIIDERVSNENINIELVRLNSLSFKVSWAKGLYGLIEALENAEIPKISPDPAKSNLLYQQIFLFNKGVIEKEDVYESNWFPIVEFPRELRFHKFMPSTLNGINIQRLRYPAARYKDYLCTFAWEYDFIGDMPSTETYDGSKSIRVSTE